MDTTTTTTYRISNRSSGADMGLWAAATETEAVAMMTRDAGYADRADLARELETTVEALDAELLVETVRVMDYDTADCLQGAPSADLVEESAAAGDTGAVAAYLDEAGVWQHVPTGDEQRRERLGYAVRTVYVE